MYTREFPPENGLVVDATNVIGSLTTVSPISGVVADITPVVLGVMLEMARDTAKIETVGELRGLVEE